MPVGLALRRVRPGPGDVQFLWQAAVREPEQAH